MRRSEYEYLTVLGVKGINQQERLADPVNEVFDARNVWAPNGRIENRPGFWGVGSALFPIVTTGALTNVRIFKESPVGVFTETTTLSSLAIGERWYLSFDFPVVTAAQLAGINLAVTLDNANAVNAVAEYWNGNSWAPLPMAESVGSSTILISGHLKTLAPGTTAYFRFPWPTDMAQTSASQSVGSNYTFRFTLQAVNGTLGFDASTVLAGTSNYLLANPTVADSFYAIKMQFPTTNKFITAYKIISSVSTFMASGQQITGATNIDDTNITSNNGIRYLFDEPPSATVIPQFNEAYVSYNYQVTRHAAVDRDISNSAASRAATVSKATVETDPGIVGPGTDYDPAFIGQLGSWPEAKYIIYHRGELWAANFKNGFNTIRWSAGTPNYKVWPTISVEVLADRDQSPITGLYPFNQNMIVFKADSIWQMVFTGENDDKLNTYRAERIVSGIGCVSNSSIQEIRGFLIFLGHDGIYAFDGATAKKISDRIINTINSIVPGKFPFASSIHWRTKSLYLLAVTTSGAATNNLVLVWDYKNDSWWIWDNINAVTLFSVDDATDTQRVYFIDTYGQFFELGIGTHDYGTAITGYVITERQHIPNAPHNTHKLRLVNVNSTNLSNSVSVELQANDAPFIGTTATSTSLSDSTEAVYNTAIYGTDVYVGERERLRSVGTLMTGEWFRAKVSHTAKNSPFTLNSIQFGVIPEGVRK